MKITGGEIKQLVRWLWFGIFSWLIAFNLREIITKSYPSPYHQITIGLVALLVGAYVFNINHYSG